MDALIVGLGSIGKSHLKALLELGVKCEVIEPRDLPKSVIGDVVSWKSFSDFKASGSTLNSIGTGKQIAVIANWGPDHFVTFSELKEMGFKDFIIEKPLVTSFNNLEKLKGHASSGKYKIWCNLPLRFDPAIISLKDFLEKAEAGPLRLISISGGANCVATNGIHWIDLMYSFTNSDVSVIQADLVNDGRNPRNPNLKFLSGFTYIRNDDGSKFVVTFSNDSYASLRFDAYWRNYRAEIYDDYIRLFKNEESPNLPINRTNLFNTLVFEAKLQHHEGMANLYRSFLKSRDSMSNLTKANEILLRALTFSSGFQTIEVSEGLMSYDWRIS